MLGFSLSKLLVLAAIVAAVWYGFRWVQRQQLQRSAERDRVERDPASSRDLDACPRCGVFFAAGAERPCDRSDCPF